MNIHVLCVYTLYRHLIGLRTEALLVVGLWRSLLNVSSLTRRTQRAYLQGISVQLYQSLSLSLYRRLIRQPKTIGPHRNSILYYLLYSKAMSMPSGKNYAISRRNSLTCIVDFISWDFHTDSDTFRSSSTHARQELHLEHRFGYAQKYFQFFSLS